MPLFRISICFHINWRRLEINLKNKLSIWFFNFCAWKFEFAVDPRAKNIRIGLAIDPIRQNSKANIVIYKKCNIRQQIDENIFS